MNVPQYVCRHTADNVVWVCTWNLGHWSKIRREEKRRRWKNLRRKERAVQHRQHLVCVSGGKCLIDWAEKERDPLVRAATFIFFHFFRPLLKNWVCVHVISNWAPFLFFYLYRQLPIFRRNLFLLLFIVFFFFFFFGLLACGWRCSAALLNLMAELLDWRTRGIIVLKDQWRRCCRLPSATAEANRKRCTKTVTDNGGCCWHYHRAASRPDVHLNYYLKKGNEEQLNPIRFI